MKLKGIKIRLYPNKIQERELNSILGGYRFVYNKCLNYKKEAYEKDKTSIDRSGLSKYFHHTLRIENDWLKQHNTKVMKQSIINLLTAYDKFFKHESDYPVFKTRHDNQSARFPLEAIAAKPFNEDLTKLNLTKVFKNLRFECSKKDRRYLGKHRDKIKSVTIKKKKCGYFYASILIEREDKILPKPINESIGIDLGINNLMAFSDGNTVKNKKFTRSNENRYKRLQRQHSRRENGSKNKEKARIKLARKYEKITNQKLDYLHKLTTKIVSENQVIILENLNVKGMMKNHKIAKSIQELSLHEIKRQLKYKAEWYGREFIQVDRYFPSSKKCSDCGEINHNLKRGDRIFTCQCGNNKDRDHNAAINILNEGIRLRELKLAT